MTAYITGVGWVSASGLGYGSNYVNFSMKKGPLPDISRKDVTVIPEEGVLSSPGLFAYTLPNCFLGEASICFGMTGTGFVINEQSSYGLRGLETAIESIECMEHEIMLCGFCETDGPSNFKVGRKIYEDTSGALFFVVEKKISDNRRNYGEITCVENNDVLFNNTVVSDFCMLAKECLENNPG